MKTNADNAATVSWLSRKIAWVGSLNKIFALLCLEFDICFISCYLPGLLNVFADLLTRNVSPQESPVVIESIHSSGGKVDPRRQSHETSCWDA